MGYNPLWNPKVEHQLNTIGVKPKPETWRFLPSLKLTAKAHENPIFLGKSPLFAGHISVKSHDFNGIWVSEAWIQNHFEELLILLEGF